ncbi:hypothetical protein KKD81_03390 [Patescibacteria group bacterium]|nr:hypothetical protein [Patescibacteria group bacterium]MBU2159131.1 hypothetical protein [Patescibacteria group bacterium]MBU2220949.1 hypothetical protein [Patescibacteria group bacterium]
MIKYGTLALMCAFGIALAGGVQAQTLNTNTMLDVNAGADSNKATVSADTLNSVDADTSTSSDQAMEDTSTSGTGTLEFSVTRESLGASGSADAMIQSSADVNSSESFRAYAQNSLESDARFEGVVVSENGMDLTYKRDARFLAVVPSKMTVQVHIDDNGSVEVKYPWYSFLMTSAESRADLEARIADEIATASADTTMQADENSVSGSASASVDVERWARILERVQAALAADASVEASS